jgi:integrase
MKTGTGTRVRFVLKKPGGGRVSFSFLRDTIAANGLRRSEKVEDSRVDAINQAHKAGKLDWEEAIKQLEDLRARLYKENNVTKTVVFNQDNLRVLDVFFKERYARRKTKDKPGAYRDYLRAVEALGMTSLRSASADDLDNLLSQFESTKQRRFVNRLRSLLKYIGRGDVELRRDKRPRRKVKHLTEAEFSLMMKRVEDPFCRTLYGVIFNSGARVGEAMALEPSDLKGNTLRIDRQMLRPWVAKTRGVKPTQDTKTESERRLTVMPDFHGHFQTWVRIPMEEKKARRQSKALVTTLKAACQAVFPDRPDKHVTCHDLRHSFAIALLAHGCTMKQVAEALGDSVAVAEEYYAGFLATDESLEVVSQKLYKQSLQTENSKSLSLDEVIAQLQVLRSEAARSK